MEKFKQKIKYDNGSIIQLNPIIADEFLVLEEQISNSIDASVDYYNPKTEEYSKEIAIGIIKINGKKSERKIIIKDNASGMKINPNKAYTIFRSTKRNDPSTVGENGMALFSVLNICNKIQIETKRRTGDYFRFGFTPNTFKISNEKTPEIEIQKIKANKNDLSSGTTITLSNFKNGVFEEIDLKLLKKELEKHFEHIIRRKRIVIKLKEDDGEDLICESFKYNDFCDSPYEKTLTKLYRTNSKKYNTEIEYDISRNPIKIFLIASKNRDLKGRVDLVVSGVGVNEMSKIDQFRTNKKYSIWNRGNVLGYIEATGVLEVNPTRKDIKNTELSKAFFSTLNKLEPEILEYIESQSITTFSERFQPIEEKINEILREYKLNSDVSISEDKFKEYVINGYRIREQKTENINTGTAKDKANLTLKSISPRIRAERNNKVIIKFPSQKGDLSNDTDLLRFKIDDINEPYQDENGQLLRSIIRENTIILFQKHEEFRKRVFQSAKGYYEFSPRSIHYIAIEILTHVKEVETRNKDEPYENIYRDFGSEIYKLEEKLNKLNGERI